MGICATIKGRYGATLSWLVQPLTCQPIAREEPVRWVSKAEAAQELEISLSTLDRMIRKGHLEVVREGRRVYVRMHGPEYPSDNDLLRRAIMRGR